MSQYVCTWCCKDIPGLICETCGSDVSVCDKTKPHHCHWSRKTITSMKCKICDRVIPNSVYFKGGTEVYGIYDPIAKTILEEHENPTTNKSKGK